MRKVAQARESPFTHNLETKRIEKRAPLAGLPKGAFARASTPLLIVKKAYSFVPPGLGNVFVDYC